MKTIHFKTPTIIQMENVECGAASLGMMLAHYGAWIPLEQLRQDCGVSRDGSKATNLIRAGEKYGLTTTVLTYDAPRDVAELQPPFIVFWGFNHFLVVEGWSENHVYLNDPAGGRRGVDWDEFDDNFTGVVLLPTPGPTFKPQGEAPHFFSAILRRLKSGKQELAFVGIAGLALVFPGLALPVATKIFIDHVLLAHQRFWMELLIGGLLLVTLIAVLLTALQRHVLNRLQARFAIIESLRFMGALLRLPMSFFAQRNPNEVAFRISLNTTVAQLLTGQLASVAVSAINIVFFAALMLAYNMELTLIGLLSVAANLAILRFILSVKRDKAVQNSLATSQCVGVSANGIQLIETLKATSTESDFFEKWAGYLARVSNSYYFMTYSTVLLGIIPALLSGISAVIVLSYGGFLVMHGGLSIGTLLAFQGLMIFLAAPTQNLVNLGNLLQELEGHLNRLDDVYSYAQTVLETTPSPAAPAAYTCPPKLAGRLELVDVTFGYSPLDRPLIEGFSLTLEPGERIALVGMSGSGKSTIGRLICGLYTPWQGQILLGGVPLADIPEAVLCESFGFADGNPFFYEGTIKENLTFWGNTVSQNAILQAAKDAMIHEDIASRPDGYDGWMSENGRNFSGGQLQRMEIARALLHHPTCLLLDEATSALDAVTEFQIDSHIRRRGCSCLVIAHRLSTIRDANEIIVMKNGQIDERGTHDHLMEKKGTYAKLVG